MRPSAANLIVVTFQTLVRWHEATCVAVTLQYLGCNFCRDILIPGGPLLVFLNMSGQICINANRILYLACFF